MREKEFVDKLAAKRDISKKEAESIVEDFGIILSEGLLAVGQVVFNDLGKFVLQAKPAREARNPMTGETVKVPAKTVAKWQPNKKFKDEVLAIAKPAK